MFPCCNFPWQIKKYVGVVADFIMYRSYILMYKYINLFMIVRIGFWRFNFLRPFCIWPYFVIVLQSFPIWLIIIIVWKMLKHVHMRDTVRQEYCSENLAHSWNSDFHSREKQEETNYSKKFATIWICWKEIISAWNTKINMIGIIGCKWTAGYRSALKVSIQC